MSQKIKEMMPLSMTEIFQMTIVLYLFLENISQEDSEAKFSFKPTSEKYVYKSFLIRIQS